jgi:hypothetical protein
MQWRIIDGVPAQTEILFDAATAVATVGKCRLYSPHKKCARFQVPEDSTTMKVEFGWRGLRFEPTGVFQGYFDSASGGVQMPQSLVGHRSGRNAGGRIEPSPHGISVRKT